MDWHELAKHKVTQLREMAQERGMKGTSGMSKDQLVENLAGKLGIEKPHLVVDDVATKTTIKAQIRALKAKRDEALEAGDHAELKRIRREIHHLKRRIHRMAHLTH